MEERGQDPERVREVTEALVLYAKGLTEDKIIRGEAHN